MVIDHKSKIETSFTLEKKDLFLYSFYLALGSVAFFIFIISGYTTIEAWLWKYTIKYLLNSAVLTIVAFTTGVLLLGSCYLMMKQNPMAKNTGIIGNGLLLIYPFAVYLLDITMPYSFIYILILGLPALFILIYSFLILRRKKEEKYTP